MRKREFYWFVEEMIVFVVCIIALPLLLLIFFAIGRFVDSITPESVKISRRLEQQRRDSLAMVWIEDHHRKLIEEDRRTEEARYKKHLLYVVARFNKKDSTTRRFIVLNTSTADIDSGRAIVFAHIWDAKSSSLKRKTDTAEIILRPIPSGKRDTLVVPQREKKMMCYTIDSVALMGIVFR